LKCHPSRPPVPEERQINRLHAEAVKRRKDAAEAKAERKRKRKEKHDTTCKFAQSEGKPRPATTESTDEEEDTPDAEDHVLGDDGGCEFPTDLSVGCRQGGAGSARRNKDRNGVVGGSVPRGGGAGVAPAGGG